MKTIFTNKGEPIYVDDWNYDWLNQYTWTLNRENGYPLTRISGYTVYMARLLGDKMGLSQSRQIDHKDWEPCHNWEKNLRAATPSQNGANKGLQRNNTSGYKGVSWTVSRKEFCCLIRYKGRRICIGWYKTAIEAAVAYNTAALKLHGEFAWLNPISAQVVNLPATSKSRVLADCEINQRFNERFLHHVQEAQ